MHINTYWKIIPLTTTMRVFWLSNNGNNLISLCFKMFENTIGA